MKKLFLLLFLSPVVYAATTNLNGAFYSQSQSYHNNIVVDGISNVNDSTFYKMAKFSGPTTIKSTTFEEAVKINGPAKIFSSNFLATLKVNGPLICSKIVASGQVIVTGEFKAADSFFNNDLILTNPNMLLSKNSEANNIIVNVSDLKHQTLTIDNSIVSGNITFQSGKGTVILKNGSKIIIGKVTGAKVIRQ